ncbi:MAG: SDR family oxidoreductase [Burkholderiaceae bacterium]|nr:SDR family oxidoreductase [Burkholderiaceae bacterium]
MALGQHEFNGRQVLVTGGTSGIGAAVSRAYRAGGARVLACAADSAELDAARADPAFDGIDVAHMDVTDADSIAAVLGPLATIDALVCSAGVTLQEREIEQDGFERVLDVNLHGSFRVATAAFDALKAGRGNIVFVASVLSFVGSARLPAYCASKGAIHSLTQSLACRWAGDGVRVNAVAPGWTETPLSAKGRANEAFMHSIEARTPMGRWAQPDEIADPVLFLGSNAARFVTGVVLPVDGGYLAAGS